MEIVPLAFAPGRARYDAVVATSAKAIPADASVDRGAPLYVVGARTADAAERRGWRLAAPPAPDSDRLAETLKRRIPEGAAVLYLAGRDRKPTLERALEGATALEVVEVYAAEARTRWRPSEVRAFRFCSAALHYSRRSAALSAELAAAAGEAPRFRAMTHVCLSGDVAAALGPIGAADVRIAARPDEESLFSILIDAAMVFPSGSGSRI